MSDTNNDWDITKDDAMETLWVPGILKNIHMKYVSNAKELSEVFASIHIFQPVPSCIIVDDYSQIISRYALRCLFTCHTCHISHSLTNSLNSNINVKNNRDILLSMNSLIANAVDHIISASPSSNTDCIRLDIPS